MMNYSLYLQGGGSVQTPTSDEQALAHQKQVDNQMAESIKLNPASLDQAIQEYGEDAPAFIKHMIDVAAENQDEQLLEILKPYAEQFNIMSFRCGGKVRAKMKKKCGGKVKKSAEGGEAPIKKEAKGGKPCPCTLHRVGGKLIEVDCNGVPVAKNGAVLKAALGDSLPAINTTLDVNPNLLGGVNYGSGYLFGNGGNKTIVSTLKKTTSPSATKPASYYLPQGKMAVSPFIYNLTQKPNADNTYSYISERVQLGLAPVSDIVLNELYSKKVSGKSPREVDLKEALMRAEEDRRLREFEERNAFGAGKQGKFGGLTYDQAIARQREMQAAKDKGFIVDLGKWGADGKWGNQSRNEWERYQAWKLQQSNAAELASLKPQNAKLQKLEAPVIAPAKIAPEAITAQLGLDKKGNIVKLNTLTPGQALSGLSNSSWENYVNQTRLRILSSKSGGKLSYKDYINLK